MNTKKMHLDKKSFDVPDHIHALGGRLTESLELGDLVLKKVTMQPGWRWSKDAKAAEGTELCERLHAGYQVSGRHHIVLADGAEIDISPGDFYLVPAGHDEWVVGDEPSVFMSIAHNECKSPLCRDLSR
jgi:uncharacterized RmlC-like cupin family protein